MKDVTMFDNPQTCCDNLKKSQGLDCFIREAGECSIDNGHGGQVGGDGSGGNGGQGNGGNGGMGSFLNECEKKRWHVSKRKKETWYV